MLSGHHYSAYLAALASKVKIKSMTSDPTMAPTSNFSAPHGALTITSSGLTGTPTISSGPPPESLDGKTDTSRHLDSIIDTPKPLHGEKGVSAVLGSLTDTHRSPDSETVVPSQFATTDSPRLDRNPVTPHQETKFATAKQLDCKTDSATVLPEPCRNNSSHTSPTPSLSSTTTPHFPPSPSSSLASVRSPPAASPSPVNLSLPLAAT